MFLDRVIPYQPSMIKVAQIQTTFVVVSHEQRCTPNVIETTGNIFHVILWEELIFVSTQRIELTVRHFLFRDSFKEALQKLSPFD